MDRPQPARIGRFAAVAALGAAMATLPANPAPAVGDGNREDRRRVGGPRPFRARPRRNVEATTELKHQPTEKERQVFKPLPSGSDREIPLPLPLYSKERFPQAELLSEAEAQKLVPRKNHSVLRRGVKIHLPKKLGGGTVQRMKVGNSSRYVRLP